MGNPGVVRQDATVYLSRDCGKLRFVVNAHRADLRNVCQHDAFNVDFG